MKNTLYNNHQLSLVASKTLVPCKEYKAGFRVCRWTGEVEDQFYSFQLVAWIEIRGLSIHHWNRVDIGKLMSKFTHILDIDEDAS